MFKGFEGGLLVVVSSIVLGTVSCSGTMGPQSNVEPVRETTVEMGQEVDDDDDEVIVAYRDTGASEAQEAPLSRADSAKLASSTELDHDPPTQRVVRRILGHELNPALVAKASEIIHQHHHQPFGTEIPFVLGGQEYVGRIEQHYHPEGGKLKPWGYHPGCSLFVVEYVPQQS